MDAEVTEIFNRLDKLVFESDLPQNLSTKSHGDELLIQGDIGGLMLLARQALYVAKSGKAGHHMHFDGASNLDECDGKFIIGFKPTDGAE